MRRPDPNKMKQVKVSMTDEMRQMVERAAEIQGHSFAAEIRDRIVSFKEEHRLVEVRMLVPKAELERKNAQA